MPYLTDRTRGPFKIETVFVEAKDSPWDNGCWSWKLVDANGECRETGTGYATQIAAHQSALAIQNNEMA